MRRAASAFVPCQTPWCVAGAAPDGVLCAVHRKRGESFRVFDGEPSGSSCVFCDGSGDCVECDGSGECECHCGDEHDCHSCSGSGHCPECRTEKRTRSQQKDDHYIEWAFMTFEPHIDITEWPWLVTE